MSPNNRSSLLLSSLSTLQTSFTTSQTESTTEFSSSTISEMVSSASSASLSPTDLKHPTPQRYTAAHSPFLKTDLVGLPTSTPPIRPVSPLSPIVNKRHQQTASFFDFDTESEVSPDSPQSASLVFSSRSQSALRHQWIDTSRPPTPAPSEPCPPLPEHIKAICQWESKVAQYPASPPLSVSRCSSHDEFLRSDAAATPSPVEQEIGALSMQIEELHEHIAASDEMFKNGMLSVYLHQNATAAALVCSPTDAIHRSPSVCSSDSSLPSPHEYQHEAMTHSRSFSQRYVKAGSEDELRMKGVKQSLRQRLENEVIEIERRAMRDLQMAREVRYGLMLEEERENARERQRKLSVALSTQREIERIKQKIGCIESPVSPVSPIQESNTTTTNTVPNDHSEEETLYDEHEQSHDLEHDTFEQARHVSIRRCASIDVRKPTPSITLTRKPSLTVITTSHVPTASALFTFLASPTPCTPSKRHSLSISSPNAMCMEFEYAMEESGRRVAACA